MLEIWYFLWFENIHNIVFTIKLYFSSPKMFQQHTNRNSITRRRISLKTNNLHPKLLKFIPSWMFLWQKNWLNKVSKELLINGSFLYDRWTFLTSSQLIWSLLHLNFHGETSFQNGNFLKLKETINFHEKCFNFNYVKKQPLNWSKMVNIHVSTTLSLSVSLYFIIYSVFNFIFYYLF